MSTSTEHSIYHAFIILLKCLCKSLKMASHMHPSVVPLSLVSDSVDIHKHQKRLLDLTSGGRSNKEIEAVERPEKFVRLL